MRLTSFSDIALRVLVLTGGAPEGQRLTTRAIADGVGAPYHHVTKTVARLSGLGLVTAVRGQSGGVTITPAGLDASVGMILRELESKSAMVACESPGDQCPLDHGCRLRVALGRAREAFYRELDGVRVRDVISERQVGPVLVQLGLRPPAAMGTDPAHLDDATFPVGRCGDRPADHQPGGNP